MTIRINAINTGMKIAAVTLFMTHTSCLGAAESPPTKDSLQNLLSPAERAAVEKEAALQEYHDEKGTKKIKEDRPSESVFGRRVTKDKAPDTNKETSSKRSSADDKKPKRSRSLSTGSSYNRYRPGRNTPGGTLKAPPGRRAFGW